MKYILNVSSKCSNHAFISGLQLDGIIYHIISPCCTVRIIWQKIAPFVGKHNKTKKRYIICMIDACKLPIFALYLFWLTYFLKSCFRLMPSCRTCQKAIKSSGTTNSFPEDELVTSPKARHYPKKLVQVSQFKQLIVKSFFKKSTKCST